MKLWLKFSGAAIVLVLIGTGPAFGQADPGTRDTLKIQSIQLVDIGTSFSVEVRMSHDEELWATTVPLVVSQAQLEPAGIPLDSVVFRGGNVVDVGVIKVVNTDLYDSTGQVQITALVISGPFIQPATNALHCRIWFTAPTGISDQIMKLDSMFFPPSSVPSFALDSKNLVEPLFIPGFVGVGTEHTSVTEYTAGGTTPTGYTLSQNYPNPFNAGTVIDYTLPRDGHVTLEVFNVLGQRVATLVDGFRSLGRQTVSWDGTDDDGRAISSGMYFYRLRAAEFVDTRKMVILK